MYICDLKVAKEVPGGNYGVICFEGYHCALGKVVAGILGRPIQSRMLTFNTNALIDGVGTNSDREAAEIVKDIVEALGRDDVDKILELHDSEGKYDLSFAYAVDKLVELGVMTVKNDSENVNYVSEIERLPRRKSLVGALMR